MRPGHNEVEAGKERLIVEKARMIRQKRATKCGGGQFMLQWGALGAKKGRPIMKEER